MRIKIIIIIIIFAGFSLKMNINFFLSLHLLDNLVMFRCSKMQQSVVS